MTGTAVAVVVVTHHGPGDTVRRCLEAIDRAGPPGPVLVVDNGDHAAAPAAEYGPGVDTVLRTANRGFGAAANAGATAARERAGAAVDIALLNDDVEVGAGWFEPLRAALGADALLGAVQPKLLLGGTDPPIVNSVGVQLDRTGAGSDVGYGAPDGAEFRAPRGVELFTGGAVLLRGEFLRAVGGFDERYFLYYEDVDLALRGHECGWSYRCVPDSVVVHRPGSSSGGLGDELRRIQERNRLWVAFRFGDAATIGRAVWLAIRRVRHAPRRAHVRALLAGVAGAPARLWANVRSPGRRTRIRAWRAAQRVS